MKIKDCKHYAIVPCGTGTELFHTNPNFVMGFEKYTEDHSGLSGHEMTYIGYLKIDNINKYIKGQPDYYKLHIFVDNFWTWTGPGEKKYYND